jgi:hypothetical protein
VVDAQVSHGALTREQVVGGHASGRDARFPEGIIPLLSGDVPAAIQRHTGGTQMVLQNIVKGDNVWVALHDHPHRTARQVIRGGLHIRPAGSFLHLVH